jgi:hypothetical protein
MMQQCQIESAYGKSMVSTPSWTCAPCTPLFTPQLKGPSDVCSTEHANQTKKREGDLKIPALVQSNAALAEPLKIPEMNYLEVNINGKGFERSLLWQLSFFSFL